MQTRRFWSPASVMLWAVLLCAAALGLAAATALSQPWLGLHLAPDAETDGVAIVRVAPDGPAGLAGIMPGRLIAVAPANAPQAGLTLEAADVIEEPDAFETFARLDIFHARQQTLHDMLAAGPVTLSVATETGETVLTVVAPERRTLLSLPPVWWAQIMVGLGGVLIGGWIFSLRQQDWGARMFALAGLSMLMFSFAAAVYSTRELALAADLFRLLGGINHAGAVLFGAAMIGLFLSYPRQIVSPVWLWLIPIILIPWLIAFELRLIAAPAAAHFIVMVEMLGIIIAAFVQWWANRKGDPRDRAALRWVGLSVVIGAGAFIAIVATPTAFGVTPVLNQGWSFLFFLLIYVGIALGLRRYRLFELDEWAFRILFYTGGLIVLIAFDAALIWLLSLERAAALGVALLGVAFLYLPLRDMAWRRMARRQRMGEDEMFQAVMNVAFAASVQERGAQWRALLQRLFDPLEIVTLNTPVTEAMLGEEGLNLTLPPAAGAPSLTLRHPWQGGSLFSARHLRLAQQIVALMRHAEESREAYERGAAGERKRIAQDLHDDVGARLLSGLHKPDISQTRETLRESIADIRTIVSGLTGECLPLDQVLGELRYEAAQRFEAAGIALDWPPEDGEANAPLLEYRVYRNLRSVLREIVSNIVRHSGASMVRVSVQRDSGAIHVVVEDNGKGFMPDAPDGRKGNGIANMRNRIAELGGVCEFPPTRKGAVVALSLPLSQTMEAAAAS